MTIIQELDNLEEIQRILGKLEDLMLKMKKDENVRHQINTYLKQLDLRVSMFSAQFLNAHPDIDWSKFSGLLFAEIGPGFSRKEIEDMWYGEKHNLSEEARKVLEI